MSAKYHVQIPCYGHAGDGNLHATLVEEPDMSMEDWKINEVACLHELFRITG